MEKGKNSKRALIIIWKRIRLPFSDCERCWRMVLRRMQGLGDNELEEGGGG